MENPRIAVTGSSGFYGRHIILALKHQFPSCEIIALDRRVTMNEDLRNVSEFIAVDITCEDEVKRMLTHLKPDVVVHTAGINPPLADRYTRRLEKRLKAVNVDGTRIMLEAAKQSQHCKAFVYTSTCCVITDDLRGYFANINENLAPTRTSTVYGESKIEAERLVIAANCEQMATCIIRPAVTFGEGDYILVPSIHACIAKMETPFKLGEGNNLWDTVYVGNVAHGHALAVKNLLTTKTARGEAFFIQNNEPITFREFSLAIWKEFGHYPPFEVKIPESLGLLVGVISEAWTWLSGTTTTLSRGSVLDACAMRYASGEKARSILGYEPIVGLEEGLIRSCREYAKRLEGGFVDTGRF